MLVRVGDAKTIGGGRIRVFEVSGSKVAVANTGDHLYAFDETCTHEGCSLSTGKLEGTTVTCPCHGSRFDVASGAVVRGPATEPVRTHRAEVLGEDLLVGD
jgi:3-phenylpropionate/trans-cinnamate dioxygenase ferredoxin component